MRLFLAVLLLASAALAAAGSGGRAPRRCSGREPAPAPAFTVTSKADRISVSLDGAPYTDLIYGAHKPYLHPLRSASGKIVSRRYPMETVAGETHDHPHHRGLWFSHGAVSGYDFWGEEASGAKAGRIVLRKVLETAGGTGEGRLAAEFAWVDPSGQPLLVETRRMVFTAPEGLRIIDVDVDLAAATAVTFGDTKEGTFAIRVAPELEEPDPKAPASPKRTGFMINAEGATGEKNIWGKRSDWVDYSGYIGGEHLGIAIFDHPGNPRHPTWWHARGYGLFAANIFGLHDFANDASKDASLRLAPGEHLRFRYRVIVHPGDAAAARIAGAYSEYARPK